MNHKEMCHSIMDFLQGEPTRKILESMDLYQLTLNALLNKNTLSEFACCIDDLFRMYEGYTQGLYLNIYLSQRIYEFIDCNPILEAFVIINQYLLAYNQHSLLGHYERVNFMKIRLYKSTYEKYIPRLS